MKKFIRRFVTAGSVAACILFLSVGCLDVETVCSSGCGTHGCENVIYPADPPTGCNCGCNEFPCGEGCGCGCTGGSGDSQTDTTWKNANGNSGIVFGPVVEGW